MVAGYCGERANSSSRVIWILPASDDYNLGFNSDKTDYFCLFDLSISLICRHVKLTLRQLQIFQEIARCGTTGAAASAVPLSQSATSAALNELERALDTQLFDRVGKRLMLNDRGRALLPAARAVLDGAHNIETIFGARDAGGAAHLQIYASTTIGNHVLPRLFARYRALRPRVQLDLQIGNTRDVVTAVREFATDLGCVEGPCHAPDVSVLPWLTDELLIVASPTHPLTLAAKRGRLKPGQLAAAHWLLREPGSGTREAVEQGLLSNLPNVESTMTLASSEAIKNAVAEGLGISCLSRAVVQDLVDTKRLVVLTAGMQPLSRRFSLIHHRDKVLSASLQDFVEYCRGFDGEQRSQTRRRPDLKGRRP
jgi:DNA-binding transcriptional LysR family regulator